MRAHLVWNDFVNRECGADFHRISREIIYFPVRDKVMMQTET